MRYLALACDYDGTLAKDGLVNDQTVAALERLKNSDRQLILVTGRELEELLQVFPQIELFERVVAENGAVLYDPKSQKEQLLGEPPPKKFARALRQQGVNPLSVGRVIVATWRPHEKVVFEQIRQLKLEHRVIFNKDAVMVLPPGIDKASGLKAALEELNLLPENTVGIGDAENDYAFLSVCKCVVAVANALPSLKEKVNFVTQGERGAGVIELIDKIIASDLAELDV